MSEFGEKTRGNLRGSAMYFPTALDGSVSAAGFNAVPNRRLMEADFRIAEVPGLVVARLQAEVGRLSALARRLALTSVRQREEISLLTKQLEAANQQLQRVQVRVERVALDPNGYYRVLGIYPEDLAGLTEQQIQKMIKNGYRTAAAIHHPDQGGDTKRAQLINEAYEHLNDSVKRARYSKV